MGWGRSLRIRIRRPSIRVRIPSIKIPSIKIPKIPNPSLRIPRLPTSYISSSAFKIPQLSIPNPNIPKVRISDIFKTIKIPTIPIPNLFPGMPTEKKIIPLKFDFPIEKIDELKETIIPEYITIPLPEAKIPSSSKSLYIPNMRLSCPRIKYKGISVSIPSASLSFPRLIVRLPRFSMSVNDIRIKTSTFLPDLKSIFKNAKIGIETSLSFPVPKIQVEVGGVSLPIMPKKREPKDILPDDIIQSAVKKTMDSIFSEISVPFPGIKIPIPDIKIPIPDIKIPIPDVRARVPSFVVLGQKISLGDVRIPIPDINLSLPDVKISIPNIDITIPDINIPKQKLEIPH